MEPRANDDPGHGRGSPVEDLAAEFLARRAAGETPELDDYLERVPEPDRPALSELIAGAEEAQGFLPTPLAGRALLGGRYRILEQIGAGGMGRVFAAWDDVLKRRVAVKALASLDAGDLERQEMFLKESRLLAALQHPNIVAVHEAGTDGDTTFIVMDLVDGRSLADVIDSARRELERDTSDTRLVPHEGKLFERAIGRPLAEGRENLIDPRSWHRSAARVALELARTLEAAHAQKVVHRDLKPHNVMLQGGGNPVVLDFGLAGSLEMNEGAVTRGLYGSVSYLAPEQVVSGKVGNDPRTDVYQLGLILYEMLTLRRAFPGQGIGEVLDRIRNGDYKPPRQWNPSIPRELAAICRMALELDPEGRYASARALREDLERWFEGREAPVALRSGRVRAAVRAVRWNARRHPVVAAAAGMCAVGLAAVLLFSREPEYVMQGFKLSGAEVVSVTDQDVVRVGDRLVVDLVANMPAHVYTLRLFGPDAQHRSVAPLRAGLVADAFLASEEGPWAREIPKGKQQLVSKEVGEEGYHRYEGLLALVSPRPRPDLEDWLSALEQIDTTTYLGSGVPYDEARKAYAAVLASSRGKAVPAISEEDLALIAAKLASRPPSEIEEDWDGMSGLTAFALGCRVAEGR